MNTIMSPGFSGSLYYSSMKDLVLCRTPNYYNLNSTGFSGSFYDNCMKDLVLILWKPKYYSFNKIFWLISLRTVL